MEAKFVADVWQIPYKGLSLRLHYHVLIQLCRANGVAEPSGITAPSDGVSGAGATGAVVVTTGVGTISAIATVTTTNVEAHTVTSTGGGHVSTSISSSPRPPGQSAELGNRLLTQNSSRTDPYNSLATSESITSNVDTTPSATPSAIPTAASQNSIGNGLSSSTKAIIVGVVVPVIIICCILLFLYVKRKRQRQAQPTNDGDDLQEHKSEATDLQAAEIKREANSFGPPPAYPYDKGPTNIGHEGNSNPIPELEPEPSHQPTELDGVPLKGREEIDSNPLHEAPASPHTPHELAGPSTSGICSTKGISPTTPLPKQSTSVLHMNTEDVSTLEQEEQRLQEEIVRLEELARLKAERDGVRQKIRDLTQDSKLLSVESNARQGMD
ncbi:MAG: hypothetical protein Q9170_002992 [Blastenia crenularia]